MVGILFRMCLAIIGTYSWSLSCYSYEGWVSAVGREGMHRFMHGCNGFFLLFSFFLAYYPSPRSCLLVMAGVVVYCIINTYWFPFLF